MHCFKSILSPLPFGFEYVRDVLVFVANNVYEAFASGTVNPVGWILVGAVDGAGAITAAKWFCTSNAAGGVCYPNFNDAVGFAHRLERM